MAEKDSTTMNEQFNQVREKLFRIQGLLDILRCAGSENEELPGPSVERVADTMYDLVDETIEVLEALERGTKESKIPVKEPPEAPLPVELQ